MRQFETDFIQDQFNPVKCIASGQRFLSHQQSADRPDWDNISH